MSGVNVNGTLFTVKLFVPEMAQKNHGHIVITSSSGKYPGAGSGSPFDIQHV